MLSVLNLQGLRKKLSSDTSSGTSASPRAELPEQIRNPVDTTQGSDADAYFGPDQFEQRMRFDLFFQIWTGL